MLAVHMVCVRKMSVSEAAANLMRSDRWVHTWLERFDAGGLDGLRDLPRSGRPPKIPREIMARIIEQVVQPRCIPRELQKIICEDTGTGLYITNVRKAMRRHGLTPKIPQKAHINLANKRAVQNWQYRFGKRISCLEEERFTIVDEDEAFFVHDAVSGCKYWFLRGESGSLCHHRKPSEDRGVRYHRQGRQAPMLKHPVIMAGLPTWMHS